MFKTLIRKIALQSATAPSPNEAKKVISATASRGPLGINMNDAFLSFSIFSDLEGILRILSVTRKIIIETIVKCCCISILEKASNAPNPAPIPAPRLHIA